ncbi:hypothetical protein HAZT_HAZT008900 [Hyalella azteca]|uniref:Uncharacterized protein n=1 Tax=Hyalella azteca TaxID=294128 RepID=A0A6A0H3G4_HYAAZ|nr:hypothetical protein HAZT_HAZT008900 [Hyalella azteca]
MRMRVIRSLVFASVSVMSFFVILSMLTNTTPASPTALHSLVTHTHNHLNHLQNNIKEEFESLVSGPDPEVLQQLGFVDKPVLYPHTNWTNLTTPVIVTAVSSSEIEAVENVVGVAAQVCPEANILIYTLDLSTKETALVELLCNDTCSVVAFDFSIYPSHVKNWRLQAYRPIIIQELLVRAGAVLWLDPTIRLVVTSSPDTEPRSRVNMSASFASGAASGQQRGTLLESLHINELSYASPKHSYASLRSTRLDEVSEDDCLLGAWRHEALLQRGVLAWQFSDPLMGRLPTAALTHPSMFSAMHTRKELYDFHQMSDAGAVLLYNTESVHRHLMKPWLMCSLSSHCVQPIGAQDTGCRFDKKPLFRYSGCHLYDASAFNVALGLMLGPHNHPHQPTSAVIFTRVPPTPAPGSDMGDISPSPQYTEPPVSNIRHLHRGTPRRWPLSSSPPLRNHSAAGSAVVVAGAGS